MHRRALNKLKAAALSGGLGQIGPPGLLLEGFNASTGLFSAPCHMSEGKSTLSVVHGYTADQWASMILEKEAIRNHMAEIGP